MSRTSRQILDLLENGAGGGIGGVNGSGSERPTGYFLYRHYDQDEKLLYVGITDQPPRRLKEHLRSAPWRGFIVSVTAQRFNSQPEAAVAERIAIRDENPIWNIHRLPVERETPVPSQIHLPVSLNKKLRWLSRNMPGGASLHALLLAGAERLADQLMIHGENPAWNVDRAPVEGDPIESQVLLPTSLHKKLRWLSSNLPGGPSLHALLLVGAKRLADQLMERLAESEKISVDELCRRMLEEMPSVNEPAGAKKPHQKK
jgi:predicted GIY-YIG superfamily endonuclease